MRTLICDNCGLATTKEFASCPACRRKDLRFHDSFNSSTAPHEWVRQRKTAGASTFASYATVACLTTGLTIVMYLCVYPPH